MTGSEHLNVGAGALDALPAEERAGFVEHLAACGTCAAEYAEFLETAARLAGAVAVAPPAELRSRVLAAAERTAQLPPDTPAAGTGQPERAFGDRLRHRKPAPWWRRPATLIAAAAAAVVLVVGGIVTVGRSGMSPDQVAAQCVQAAADAQVQVPSVGSGGSVTIARSCDAAVVRLAAMPEQPAGKGYQLWVMSGDQARSVGMVTATVQSAGDVVVTGLRPSDTDIGISVEPAGGSKSPTTKPVWVVPIKA